MTPAAWFMAGWGTGFGLSIAFLVAVDVLYVEARKTTISRKTLTVWQRWPVAAAVFGAMAGLIAGTLLGHFGFPQVISQ